MKFFFLTGILFLYCYAPVFGQTRCGTQLRSLQAIQANPSVAFAAQKLEKNIQILSTKPVAASRGERPSGSEIITIPVIVHIVYHLPAENISDQAVLHQLDALNRDYRRQNADSINTPGLFKGAAGDAKIQFALAKTDPQGRAATGIERLFSPVERWSIEGDKVKSRTSYGANAWDAASFLNIWVCNLDDLLGYSSMLTDDPEKDGVVINYTVFDNLQDGGPYHSGRTAVHEIGHWLGLKHLWGDTDCGDDGVNDTPAQSTFTTGCPSGIRQSCGNAPTGDMYMNFMDYTNDPCMNLFTRGQTERMQSIFREGGLRHQMLSSKALGDPWTSEIPVADDSPGWFFPRVYPNPGRTALTIDLKYEPRWIGQELTISDVSGKVMSRQWISATITTIQIGKLLPGIYFLCASGNGQKLKEKFIKF